MAIPQRALTLDAFLRLPEEQPALEFVGGRIRQKVSPKAHHGKLQLTLGRLVDEFGQPRRLASAFTETRVSFAGDSFVPDLVIYRWGRVPRDADGRIAADFFAPPDIAVEIASPGQTIRSLSDRCRWYVENGVEISLLVDPRTQTVRLFRAGQDVIVLRGDDRIDLDSVLPGFELTVRQLFDALWLR